MRWKVWKWGKTWPAGEFNLNVQAGMPGRRGHSWSTYWAAEEGLTAGARKSYPPESSCARLYKPSSHELWLVRQRSPNTQDAPDTDLINNELVSRYSCESVSRTGLQRSWSTFSQKIRSTVNFNMKGKGDQDRPQQIPVNGTSVPQP